jgi:RNA polymerase sigma factor (sigma-70 family)
VVQTTGTQNPDMSGFSEFYISNSNLLIRFLITLGASRSDAEDMAQEAMKAALLRWPTLTHPAAFVRTIAQRGLYRRWENDRRRARGEQEATGPVRPHVAGFDFDDDSGRLLAMVRRLPTTQREVMAWAVDGYSAGQIAAVMGLKQSTVRSHLRHARNSLRQSLEGLRHHDGKESGEDG